VALVELSLKKFLTLQLKVKTMSPPSDREDKKVRTDDIDEEVQQDDLKKMGEVTEIAEFFNMVPKKERQEFFLLRCVKLLAQLLREHHITSLLHMTFPSAAKTKMITSTKKLQNLTIKPYMKHMPRKKEVPQMQ
jgi:hypothetical protein